MVKVFLISKFNVQSTRSKISEKREKNQRSIVGAKFLLLSEEKVAVDSAPLPTDG